MLRSIAAVLAGLVVTIVLVMVLTYLAGMIAGVGPTSPPTTLYLVLNLVGGVIAGASGGATAVRLAPHTPHGHVWALAFVVLLLSLPTLFSAPSPGQPEWYGAVLSVLGPVSVLLGGVAAARARRAREANVLVEP
ncbi:MAG: hypothetical protein WD766_07970 [Gemmatimonadota bacterium]